MDISAERHATNRNNYHRELCNLSLPKRVRCTHDKMRGEGEWIVEIVQVSFVTQRILQRLDTSGGLNWMADGGTGCVNTTCGVIIRKHAWQQV